ncbi:LysR substrate-binding domain-containing protein [Steroidobacter cummioxidans]|uniref:LysR substrate-binding domain-containing protein n=1 Tax=Steroidobacter cummioxidans TaxID=1803913 RepID=UPI000E31C01B|nr:LysR substrate-binding domain-containing protein [Steroidobacter cummioxidans]
MTLTQLRYFAAIIDAGLNVTFAAKKMHGTQSGLSKQVKQLEDELGFSLFVRRARSLVALTPEGERVLEHVRPLLDHARNIRALSANLRNAADGELHIATTHTQARHVLPRVLARLKKSVPKVTVHLAPGSNSESLARLRSGEVDLAIVSTGTQPPDADVTLPLYRWERVVVVPTQHRLARLPRPLELRDLAEVPLISYESSRDRDSSLRLAFQQAQIEPVIAMTAPDADLIKTYVRAGQGVGILAEMALGEPDDQLAAITADGLFPTCTAWLLLRRDRLLRDYTLALIGDLLPHIHAGDLRSVLDGSATYSGPIPHWRDSLAPVRLLSTASL